MEHFFGGSATLKGFGKLTQKRRFVFVMLLIWVNVPIPSRKCSIKAPAKFKTSVYVLTGSK